VSNHNEDIRQKVFHQFFVHCLLCMKIKNVAADSRNVLQEALWIFACFVAFPSLQITDNSVLA